MSIQARVLSCFMVFIMLFSCVAFAEEGAAQAETAVEITKKAKITVSAHKNDKGYLTDGNIRETWFDEGRGYMEFTLPKETPCWGIYIQFDTILDTALQVEDENGEWADAELLPGDYYNKYVPLEGLTHFRIQNKSGKDKKLMGVREVHLLSAGALPDWVQVWQPFEGKADLLVISAHPDDELIFFGGTIPYYAVVQGKKVQVAYIASVSARRRIELLDGLWSMGVRTYPQMPTSGFKDVYSGSKAGMYQTWREENLEDYITWLLRYYRPDVVVTHDLGGEYGHGAHKCVAAVTCKAVEKLGAKANYNGGRSKKLDPWQVKKLYIHLYEKNSITMDWGEPQECYGGKTCLEMAQAAFKYHVSQQSSPHSVEDVNYGVYNNKVFGLYYTAVGPDTGNGNGFIVGDNTQKFDFFENIESAEEE